MNKEEAIKNAYELFNARRADELLMQMTPDVRWPNGWEGGYVNGREEVKEYWTRQWKEIDPEVIPQSLTHLPDGRLEVMVQQTVKDLGGVVLSSGLIKHIYTFNGDLISEMQIEAVK